jgi:peptide/nickel transport system substrate-binding protein
MKNRILQIGSIIFVITMAMFYSCKGKKGGVGGTVVIREMGDADMLNPLTLSSANARVIVDQIFMSVNTYDPNDGVDFKYVPALSTELAKATAVTEGEWKGGMRIEFTIRDEAKWDNGTPITVYDYIFSLKCILNPKTNCDKLRSYYEWVGDVEIDTTNLKKVVVYSNKLYFKVIETATSYIIPEYNYDPNKLMRKFSLRDMNTEAKRSALKSNSDILKFADEFNSEKFQRDPAFVSGSGPYKLESWTTGQEIVLKRKDSWWGDKFKDLRQFWAFPKKLKFRVINDQNTALTALKDGTVDVFEALPPKDYEELLKNAEFTKKVKISMEDYLGFTFFYLNLRNDKFKDINVRKALAHAIDRDKINATLNFGTSTKTESFVHPKQSNYDKDLPITSFDLQLANQLLDQAGWKDSDGDGIRDKMIHGRKVPLSFDFLVNAGNKQRMDLLLIVQEDYKKIGVQLNIQAKEWTVMLQELDKLQYEMAYGSFTIDPIEPETKQLWHTSNANPGGDNKAGWGTPQSDKIIDDMNAELDPAKRKILIGQLQKMLHDDFGVIFLFSPKNRIAINKKFDVQRHWRSPGYFPNEIKLVGKE